MGVFDLWREARGNVMRKELDDVLSRMRKANDPARSAFLNNVGQTIGPLRDSYGRASTSERKLLLKQCRAAASRMWDEGDWPSSLGLAISCLNAESEHVPGSDAAYVRGETGKIIAEAHAHLESKNT